jgi:hypothetical protein
MFFGIRIGRRLIEMDTGFMNIRGRS